MRTPIACCLTTAIAILLLPALTSATPKIGEKSNGFNLVEERYLHTYVDCWDAFKARCGRNIVDDQLSSGEVPSQGRVQRSIETMDRWLHPAPAPAIDSPTISTPAPAPVSVAPAPASTGGCPASMAPESGSAGYSAYNPSSGATGCYQIIPSTAAAHGCDLSTPAGQDACAAEICATQGSGAWAASGASPC
jgi:hypothetical protein